LERNWLKIGEKKNERQQTGNPVFIVNNNYFLLSWKFYFNINSRQIVAFVTTISTANKHLLMVELIIKF